MKINNRGFTLVEIMVAVGLLGGLSLVVMNLTKQSTKSSTKYQFDTEINLINNEIIGILSDPNKCLATFRSGAANVINPTNINGKYYVSTDALAPAGGYGNGGVNINAYTFSATAFPSNDGILNITFQNKNILKGSAGPATVQRKINLYIEQDATGLILKCRSLSSSSTDIWTRGSGADISYSGGNVGVGTLSPKTTFDVEGGIRPGSVGVTVGGACNPEGTFAYDKGLRVPVYCANTLLWTAMGGITCVTRSAPNAVSCLAGEIMTGASCLGVDVCSGNDSSAYGGALSATGITCSPHGCTVHAAYVRCCK